MAATTLRQPPTITEAALTRRCDHCGAKEQQRCTGPTGKPASFHSVRLNQFCRAQYLEHVWVSPWCAQHKGHKGRHRTLSGDLTWDEGAGFTASQLLEMLDEA